MVIDQQSVMDILASVPDPEIPAVSVVDLGIVESVSINDVDVQVTCLPTFVGCPALDAIRSDIETALRNAGAVPTVRFVYSPPWTTERITEQGHRKLKEYGLAPPNEGATTGKVQLSLISSGECPYCGSRDTVLESPFGPTACRATCYCRACRNPFEMFKPV